MCMYVDSNVCMCVCEKKKKKKKKKKCLISFFVGVGGEIGEEVLIKLITV